MVTIKPLQNSDSNSFELSAISEVFHSLHSLSNRFVPSVCTPLQAPDKQCLQSSCALGYPVAILRMTEKTVPLYTVCFRPELGITNLQPSS